MKLTISIFLIIAVLCFAAVSADNVTSTNTPAKSITTAKTTTKITTKVTTKIQATQSDNTEEDTPSTKVTTRSTTRITTRPTTEETTEEVTDTPERTTTSEYTPTTETTPTRTLRPRNATLNTTIPTTTSTTIGVLKAQANADASLDKPAYFLVTPVKGSVVLKTNEGTDWVIEYVIIGSNIRKLNEKGTIGAEVVDINSDGTPIYVKITPFLSGITKNVVLSGEGVQSITAKSETPGPFKIENIETGDVPAQSATKTPEPTKSPASPALVLFAFGISLTLIRMIKR